MTTKTQLTKQQFDDLLEDILRFITAPKQRTDKECDEQNKKIERIYGAGGIEASSSFEMQTAIMQRLLLICLKQENTND